MTGATTLSDSLDIAGNFDISSGMFTVEATSGDTAIAGMLNVTGIAS